MSEIISLLVVRLSVLYIVAGDREVPTSTATAAKSGTTAGYLRVSTVHQAGERHVSLET